MEDSFSKKANMGETTRRIKKDEQKNVPSNCFKMVAKAYESESFEKKVLLLHQKLGISNSTEAKSYFSEYIHSDLPLKKVHQLLDY